MPSPAQFLPTLILEAIVEYTVGEYKWKNIRGNVDGESAFRFTLPLLEVCSAWREAALDRIYRDAWWCSNNGHSYRDFHGRRYLSVHSCLSKALEINTTSRVKSVRLRFESLMVLDGSPLELFDAPLFRNQMLPGVTDIDFTFEGDWRSPYDNTLLDSSVTAQTFCDNISRMFPNAKARRTSMFQIFGKHTTSPFVRTLMSGLFANTTAIKGVYYHDGLPSCLPDNIPNLRHLSAGHIRIESPEIELICRNTKTLEHLEGTFTMPHVFTKIVIDDGGMPIVYPRVRCLDVSFRYKINSENGSHLYSPAGTPFPSLETLKCRSEYPFGNDILFRGNEHTLEYLDINIGPKAAQTLKSYGVFTPARYPTLRYASGYISGGATADGACVAVGLFLQFAANASVIWTDGARVPFSSLGMAIGNFGQNITILSIPSITFTLHETLELVRQLPRLNRLDSNIIATDELRGMDRLHDRCLGECRNTWNEKSNADESSDGLDCSSNDSYDRHHQDSFGFSTFVHTRNFFFAHQDAIYADMGFIEELYRQYYPLSNSLYFLGACKYSSYPMAGCRMIALLCILCPTIRHVQTHMHVDEWDFEDFYIERHEIDEIEQHASLVSRLQLSGLSIS